MPLVTTHPASLSTEATVDTCRQSTPVTITSPPAQAPQARSVAATMRSPIMVHSPRSRGCPPSTVTTPPPAPATLPPRRFRKSARATISGSRAALVMVVMPDAPQAARMAFSVAPTLARDRWMSPP